MDNNMMNIIVGFFFWGVLAALWVNHRWIQPRRLAKKRQARRRRYEALYQHPASQN